MKADNPFTLTFGKTPGEYIPRYEKTQEILDTFSGTNPVSQTYLIEGIRGSGKTVLMTAIAKELASSEKWIVVNLNMTRDLMEDLAVKLSEKCSKLLPDLAKTGFSISVAGFGLGLNAPASVQNYSGVISELLSRLQKKKKRVLITIDEVSNSRTMKEFASEFQIFLREDYPLFLIMTGLYENIYNVQNDPSLTFLLRSPKLSLEPLSIAQITKQYAHIFHMEKEPASYLAGITKGYAFAFQALGMLYYEYRDDLPVDEILSKLDDMLDDFVYRKIWDGLSTTDRQILKVLSDEPMRVNQVCEKLNMSSSSFSTYRKRLINRGLINGKQHGYVSLALPRFAEVIDYYHS